MKETIEKDRGITLIALVITIIVLLILAGIAISMLSGENGILRQAAKAKKDTEEKSGKEQIELAVTGAMTNKEHQVKVEDLIEELERYDLKLDDEEKAKTNPDGSWYVTTKDATYKITKNGEVEKKPKLIINEEVVTPENVRKYLGKKVTNYKGKESVTIDDIEYTVSPEYRLYYIDFTGKYGDKGVVYLKAECTSNSKSLPVTETVPEKNSIQETIKIKDLNPELYKDDNTGPATSNDNMKAVTWLTNTEHWKDLADESHTGDINYIVGAPSLEMMMDSYNMYYDLEDEEPQTGSLDTDPKGSRNKLFYKYTQGDKGYKVGPSNSNAWDNSTSDYSVKTDPEIDSMYYPGGSESYWLASPSDRSTLSMMFVGSFDGGYVYNGGKVYNAYYSNFYAFCPLVSLKSSIKLELEGLGN